MGLVVSPKQNGDKMKYLLGLVAFSIGCTAGKESTDTSTEEASTEEASSEEAFAPTEGQWASSDLNIISDTCNFGEGEDTGGEEDQGGTVTLTMVDATTFSIVDEAMNLTCTLSGMDFTCEDMSEVIADWNDQGMVAVITMTMTQSGTFSSSTEGSLSMGYGLTCEGDDCEGVAEMAQMTLPCESSATATINLVE